MSSNIYLTDLRVTIPGLCPDLTGVVISYLGYSDQAALFETCKNLSKLGTEIERKLYSRIPIFGRKQWKDYWGAKITDRYDVDHINPRVLREFLKVYCGPNPIGPGSVKDACLTVTVVPTKVYIEGKGWSDYTLNVLDELAECPKMGHAAEQNSDLQQHGAAKAERVSLVILLGDVVARNQSWEEQVVHLKRLNNCIGYGCETEPDAPSQNTVLFAHHAVTGEQPRSNTNCRKGPYRRTKEFVLYGPGVYHMISGGFSLPRGSALAGLDVGYANVNSENVGAAVLRKF